MGFNLNRKIEEIRQKPEHIRIRYVWGMVAASMFLIVIIWAVSVKENFQTIDLHSENLDELKGEFEKINEGLPSRESFTGDLDQSLLEGEVNLDEDQESITSLGDDIQR